MNFNEYFERACSYYEDRDYGPALKNFEAALKLKPDNKKLQHIINEVKLCAQEKEQADDLQSKLDKLRSSS